MPLRATYKKKVSEKRTPFFISVFKIDSNCVIIFTGDAMTETITYTLQTGAELTIYRTATFGDIAVLSALVVVILFMMFSGIYGLTKRRRML